MTVAVRADDPYLDPSTLTATDPVGSGGNFSTVDRHGDASTTVTDTTDTTTLILSAASSVAEGSGTLTYTATLSNAAQGEVTVNLDGGRTITIADGATQGTVSVAVRADDPYVDPSTLTATDQVGSGREL